MSLANVPDTMLAALHEIPHSVLTTTLKGSMAELCLQDEGPHSPNIQKNCLLMAHS